MGLWTPRVSMKARGMKAQWDPMDEAYGTVAVFEDLCGNRWDLLRSGAQRGNTDGASWEAGETSA